MGTSPRGLGLPARLYRWSILRIMPPRWRSDAEEMTWDFWDLWLEDPAAWARTRLACRAFGRLPLVAAKEWLEDIGLVRPPGSGPARRRWGMSIWITNLRLALRTLGRAPGFALTTVVLLGLGVGAVTTIFTVVDHVLLRALPYPEQDRLIELENGSHPGVLFRDLANAKSVDRWAATWSETANLTGVEDPIRIERTRVSEEFFSLYGARPAVGRLLLPSDFAAADVAVLSHPTWERVFGADPEIMGRTLRVDGVGVKVVGVLNRGFVPPEGLGEGPGGPDLWMPMDWTRQELSEIGFHVLDISGHMAPGATLADVEAEMALFSQDLARRFPDNRLTRDGEPFPFPPALLKEATTRRVRGGLGLLLGAVGLLLLVACFNVAHLFLARGLGRTRDMAVRRALGAGTPSLVQQLLAESLILGGAGGVLGLGLAWAGLRVLLALNPTELPWASDVSMDLRIVAFVAGISAGTVLLFGLIPALRSMGKDLVVDLKGASRSATSGKGALRLRSGLVVLEVAVSLVLVSGAGLLLRSFMELNAMDPGFKTEGLWVLDLNPTEAATADEYREQMSRVEASLASAPGVASATYGLSLPFQWTGGGRCCWSTNSARVGDEVLEGRRIALHPVTGSYFRTLSMPMIAGRGWGSDEAEAEPWPVVLTEGLAVELFGSSAGAIGQAFSIGGAETPVRVMGVVADNLHYGLDQPVPTSVYLPMEKLEFVIPLASFAVRTEGDARQTMARTLREAVWRVMPDLPVPSTRTMEDLISESTAGQRFDSVLFSVFGVMALLLAAAGLYGTLLYTVGQRRKELGIRMALGAGRRGVERRVVAQGLALAAFGCALGIGGVWGTGRLLETRLFQVNPADTWALAGSVAVLLTSAVLASWFPARRAAGVDPIEVLREE